MKTETVKDPVLALGQHMFLFGDLCGGSFFSGAIMVSAYIRGTVCGNYADVVEQETSGGLLWRVQREK